MGLSLIPLAYWSHLHPDFGEQVGLYVHQHEDNFDPGAARFEFLPHFMKL